MAFFASALTKTTFEPSVRDIVIEIVIDIVVDREVVDAPTA